MTALLLDNLELFFASLPQNLRADAEYFALREAVRGPQVTPEAIPYLGLPRSLQERILDIIVKTRSRPSNSSS